MEAHRDLADRFVTLLATLGSGKLKDGHWPISPWEAAPGVARALAAFSEVYDGRPLSLPWAPTTFLNLYYCAGLALASPGHSEISPSLPTAFMKGFDRGRPDRLANNGTIRFEVQEPHSLERASGRVFKGPGLSLAFRLCAAMTAYAECTGWSMHRLYSEFHGPYRVASGASYLIQTSDFGVIAHEPVLISSARSARLHLRFRLLPQVAANVKLDFFGHLGTSLCSFAESATLVLSEDGRWQSIGTTEAEATLQLVEQQLEAEAEVVNKLTQAQLCAGMARRYLAACLTAAGATTESAFGLLQSFPNEIEPQPRWQGSREQFLQYVRNAIDR